MSNNYEHDTVCVHFVNQINSNTTKSANINSKRSWPLRSAVFKGREITVALMTKVPFNAATSQLKFVG